MPRSGGHNKSPESWGWPWVNFAGGSHGRGNNGARMWTLASYSSYSALQGPLILIAVSVHQQPVAILAVLVLIHLLAATSFGSKLLTRDTVSPRTSCLPAPAPAAGNHLLCPSPSFSDNHRSRWRRPAPWHWHW